jgi:hypothetical protein
MADETPININIDSPQVDAPVQVSFGSIFEGFRATMDEIVDDIKSGSTVAMTGLFLGAMFIVAGIYMWRRV